MATLCKNCGRPVTFDPYSQKLSCDFCGSKFAPGDLEEYASDLLEGAEPRPVDDPNLMDCYIYSCSACGGEVVVNGTESSTTCIYCGSTSVVFSRISRQRRPECIIPFKITKEEALEEVNKQFKKGAFIPKEIKNFKSEDVKGIYLPYWVVDAEHYGSVGILTTTTRDKKVETVCYARAGAMKVKSLPVDATGILSPESCSMLEPYNTKAMKPFDENYLLGFYSNIADISFGELEHKVNKRAGEIFNEFAIKDVPPLADRKIEAAEHDTSIDYGKIRYAMFPAWFITYRYNGLYNTILVNGETGKVVCGVPWDKRKVTALFVISGIAASVLAFFLCREIFNMLMDPKTLNLNPRGSSNVVYGFSAIVFAAFAAGIRKFQKLLKSLRLTQAKAMFNFVKKRQG